RFIIRYIYPLEGNEGATGLDIGSESNRRNAALNAASSGAAQLTEPITLVQASGQKNAGFLLLMPVYTEGANLTSVEGREAASIGWAYSPIVVDEVLAQLGIRGDEIAFSISDAGSKMTFFSSSGFDGASIAGSLDIPMYGRIWHIDHHPLPPFFARNEFANPYGAIIFILITGLIFASAAYGIARNQQRNLFLRERSRQLTEAIVDGAPLALLVLDGDRRIVRANTRSTQLFGCESRDLVGRPLSDLVASSDRLVIPGAGEPALPVDADSGHVVRRMDGSEVPVDLQFSDKTVPGANFVIVGIVDITNQREAIRVLSESERRWQEMADHLPHLVWTCNPTGECDFLSHQWVEYTGIPAEQQLGFKWVEQVHPDDVRAMRDAWERSVTNLTPFSVEFRIRRHDGQYRLFFTLAEPVLDENGNVLRWIGSNTDIEDRFRAEQEVMNLLREMEQRVADRTEELDTALRDLNSILNAIPSPIAYWDRDQRNRFSNAAHEQWYGCEPDWLKGRHARELLGEEMYNASLEQIRGVLSGEAQQWEREMVDRDGVPRVAQVSFIPDIHQEEVRGYYVILLDITEIKASEQAQKMAREMAEQATRAKSAFLTSMSHELRTPMNSILGFSDLLLSQHFGPLNEKQADYQKIIKKSGEHLLRLMDSVLELSKIEAGKVSVSIEPVNVVSIIRSVIASLEPLAKSLGIEIRKLKAIPGDLYVEADQTRLTQVLINLGSNAIKYNRPDGWVEFGCTTTPDDMVRISVTDNGLGIPEDRQHGAFEAFNRMGAEDGKVEGSGIGLALVRNFVGLMGGRIDFESREGEGSRFWIELPISEAIEDNDESAAPISASVPASATVSMLYVEDNDINRELFRSYADLIGNISLTEAENGVDGLRMARAQRPDIVFLDINLPGLDGYAVVKALKSDIRTSGIKVVALTANAMAGDADRGLEAGFDGYLTKPVRLNHIQEMVSRFSHKEAS
ncbi:MAG: PAS domain S-box protein, partial [Rhodospirillales bacterium]